MQAQGKEGKASSMESIVADIRIIRDARIRNLMRDPDLLSFLEEHFDVVALSLIKKEFLKRELQELTASSLDLVHYGTLIREMRDSTVPVSYDNPLFNSELKSIFQRYV